MSSHPAKISIDDIAPILLEELSYGNTLPAKSFHKISYFIHKDIQRHNELESGVELFWYKYGTCVRTTDAQTISIRNTGAGSEVVFHQDRMQSDLDAEVKRKVRGSVSDAVSKYYEFGLDGITDEQYEQAPYQIQRCYRKLDQHIQGVIDRVGKGGTNFDRKKLRRLQAEFTKSFPTNIYPRLKGPLMKTQSVISERLDNEDTVIGDIDEILDTFWTLFCLDLAADTCTNVSSETVLEDLQIEHPDERRNELQRELNQYERIFLRVRRSGPLQTEAADSVMASRLECGTVMTDD